MAHVDICDGNDETSIRILREALIAEGADFQNKEWAIGVDMYQLMIGSEEVRVFIDTWSVDIEGNKDVLEKIKSTYNRLKRQSLNAEKVG